MRGRRSGVGIGPDALGVIWLGVWLLMDGWEIVGERVSAGWFWSCWVL